MKFNLFLLLCLSFGMANAMFKKPIRKKRTEIALPGVPGNLFPDQPVNHEELLSQLQGQLSSDYDLSPDQKGQMKKCNEEFDQGLSKRTVFQNLVQLVPMLDYYPNEEKQEFARRLIALKKRTPRNTNLYKQIVRLEKSILATFWSSKSGERRFTPDNYRTNN